MRNRFLLTCVTVAVLNGCFAIRSALAIDLYAFDLDSLCYMSTLVAQGEVVKAPDISPEKSSPAGTIDFRVDTVYFGEAKGGTVIPIAGTWLYSVLRTGSFKVGDKLFVFLRKNGPRGMQEVQEDSLIPVDSGFKIVIDGKVCSFLQESNPGGYEAITPECQPNGSFPTVADFKTSLDASLRFAAKLKEEWNKHAVASESPRLLELLKQRREVPCDAGRQADWVGHLAALRLVSLFDPPSTYAGIDADPNQAPLLANGFNTPEGREFLLKKVADRTTPSPRRATLASDLAGTYAYSDRMTNGADGDVTIVQGARVPNNGDYLKRCAALAVSTEDSPDVCLAILRALEFSARWNDKCKDAGIKADLANSAEVLRSFYAKTSLDEAKYEIEIMTLAIGADAYSKLKSKSGGIIGIVRRDQANERSQPDKAPGRIYVDFSYSWPAGFKGIDSMHLQMQSVTDNKIYPLPEGNATPDEHDDHGVGYSAGTGMLVTPPSVPKGRYHIFYQFMHGKNVVGQSFGFDLDR